MKTVLCIAFAMAMCGAAGADVEGQVERLVEWQEAPLDLLRADQSDLELLPGVGTDLASAILGLRALGELRSVEDLAAIPGLDAARLDAIRPYVRLEESSSQFAVHWSSLAQSRDGAPPRVLHRVVADGPGTRAWGLWSDDAEPRWRGAAIVTSGPASIFAGELRMDAPGGLFDFGGSRPRLAAAARPRPARTGPRTDASGERGMAGVALAFPAGLVFSASNGEGPTSGAAITLRSRSLAVNAALRAGDPGWGAAIDVARAGDAWIGLTAEENARSARAGIRFAGQQWRLGLDASTTDGLLGAGSDALSGHRLDRTHHCVQVHGRMRSSAWSGGGIWRELVRGDIGPVGTVEFDLAWNGSGPVDAVTIRMRAIPESRVSVQARRIEGRREWRIRFARESTGSSTSELLGAELRQRAGGHELRLALVGVDGTASRVWMLSRPQTGIYPVWIRPGGGLAAAGWGLRTAAMRVGAWFWLRVGPDRPPSPGLGLFCSVEAPRMV